MNNIKMSRKWIESNMKHDDKLTIERLRSEPGIKEYLNSLPVSKRDKLIGEAVDAGNLTEDLEIFKKLDKSQPWLDKVSKETKKGGRKRRTKRRSKKQRKTRKYMRK
jgi:hypothetical protein